MVFTKMLSSDSLSVGRGRVVLLDCPQKICTDLTPGNLTNGDAKISALL